MKSFSVLLFILLLCNLVDAGILPRISRAGGSLVRDGSVWTPRGFNYIRLNTTYGGHSTFSAGMDNVSAVQRTAVHACRTRGYNFVRVFIDNGAKDRSSGIGGNPSGPQILDSGYISRLADFVTRFAAQGCYTMITINACFLPQNAYWASRYPQPCPSWAQYPQCVYMTSSHVNVSDRSLLYFTVIR